MISHEIFTQNKNKTALKDSTGLSLTYGELQEFSDSHSDRFGICTRELVLILSDNTVDTASFFVACLHNRIVPLLINSGISDEMLQRYVSIYKPNYIYKKHNRDINGHWQIAVEFNNSVLLRKKEQTSIQLYDGLSHLLPTSGSTGSPKLVRHSYQNITANAMNVAKAFNLNGSENAMLVLPIFFTQGLSVLCSHLCAGSSVYLTDASLSSREFWNAMKNEGITSFTGVPYSFELLDKLRFYTMKLPDLTVLSQGGGRMSDVLWDKITKYALDTDKKFYATYGASETSARMSLLPSELATEKRCSIGKPIGDYEMWLEDEDRNIIRESDKVGELVFKGESVTLGYAETYWDLEKGDERQGIYRTGDIAYCDSDGFYYITGRLARFIKIFGLRINLDETDRLIKTRFGEGYVCAGSDDLLCVFSSNKSMKSSEIVTFLKDTLKINVSAFRVIYIDEIPRNNFGKINYGALNNMTKKEVSS